jgi:hypothetical protein
MRHLKYVIPVLVVLLVVVGGWLFWEEQQHNLQNSTDDNGLPSQDQRAAVLALIPQQCANLYSLPNNQVQNLTNLPRVNDNAIGSMIVHLQPVAIGRPMVLPGVKTNTIAPISTSMASALILNFPPGLTSDYQPTLADVERAGSCDVNPVDLALRIQPRDQDLINWLHERQWELAHQNPQDAEVNEAGDCNNLLYILSNTQLSWFELYEMGTSFYNFYNGDYQTAAVFYVEVITRAHRVLTKLKLGAPEIRPILLAMHKTKVILWDMVGNGDIVNDNGDRSCLQSLYMLDNDLVHWGKPGDPVLEFALQHGKIGTLECLILMGKLDEAIAVGEKTDLSGMTKDEKAEIAWAVGHALYYKHRYVDAIPQLTICADDPTSNFCSFAWQLLILALYQSGKVEISQSAYKQYIHDFHPNSPVIVELSVIFSKTNIGESASTN